MVKAVVDFVTNICDHHSQRLFELLDGRFELTFYFTGAGERYRGDKSRSVTGNFKYRNVGGFPVLPRVRVSPGILVLWRRKQDVFIKTVDDRFALPAVFFMARLKRTPLVLWTGIWQHPATRFHRLSWGATRFLYARADALVVYGEHVKRYLVSQGVETGKIFCAPHAVDNGRFNQPVDEAAVLRLRQELDAQGKRVVLFVGRLEQCKGLDFLIEAVGLLERPDVLVVLIGNGPIKNACEALAAQKGVTVRFVDYVPNPRLALYYAIADVFVLPSVTTDDFKEPWGLVVNEAMNQGCPVIVTEAVGAGAGGLVKDGINGFVVPEKDHRALAAGLAKILTDRSLRARLSANARAEISKWTPEKMADGFEAAVHYALRKKGKDP